MSPTDRDKPTIPPVSEREDVSSTPSSDLENLPGHHHYGSNRREHVFSDPAVAAHWQGIYDEAEYEGRHRFDPECSWTAEEERGLVRKVDFRIMLWCWVMFFALDLNRKNINRAISDNMLEELGMDTDDYNNGQTILLVSFLAAELPSGLISKKLGPDIWIPFIICAWSVVSAAQAGLTNITGYYVCRCLLGLLMGGFIPDTVLYITYWYKSQELPIRLSWFWTVLSVTQIVGSFIASGVLQMRGLQGWSGWQWLFLIEGSITAVIGLASWGLMPASISQTSGWLRGRQGWFSEREEKILVNRLLRDDPSKGDMNNRQAVDFARFWKALKDFDLWPLYLVGLMNYIPPAPPANYLSYILRQMGYSTLEANLLTIPSQFLFGVNLLLISWVSERLNERGFMSSLSNIWILPWLAALVALGSSASDWVRYALLTGLLSYPYCHAILVAWNSRNSNSVRTRAVSAALYNMFVQAGNIIGVNIYRENDRPFYIRGNKILLGICCFNVVLLWVVKYYYVARNEKRQRAWAKMSGEEQADYSAHTTDEGAKRLDFRFAT
ncbi:MFS transporter [Lecanosticta acicola]|uniref:MFS transporter n=1 Tax=Lecanosticta acicola TaxID=111012 RepID=A0AAI8Z2V5_9PEZI|nr:MFS transporter [Lecanosticta acicola]